jgi:hypothetical protein
MVNFRDIGFFAFNPSPANFTEVEVEKNLNVFVVEIQTRKIADKGKNSHFGLCQPSCGRQYHLFRGFTYYMFTLRVLNSK